MFFTCQQVPVPLPAPKLPPESRKLAGFLPVPPVTKDPPFSKKHRIPTPCIRGGTEGNTFHCRKQLNLSESITLFFMLAPGLKKHEETEGLQCSQNTCSSVLFPHCNVQGRDARVAKLQESRKVGHLDLNISKSCTQHIGQGPPTQKLRHPPTTCIMFAARSRSREHIFAFTVSKQTRDIL